MSEQGVTKNEPSIEVSLWGVNRWLRYSGLRLYVAVWDGEGAHMPTMIGLMWAGLPGSKGWRKWEA